MTATGELKEAIEGLYTAFSKYPQPKKVCYCPCGCTKQEEVSVLLSAPLRELSFSELHNYCVSAMTTQGSVEDFKFFLPCLFQGICEESFSYNAEILFGKLSYGKYQTWGADEVEAIRNFLMQLWNAGLASFPISERFPAFEEVETLLCCVALPIDNVKDYLDLWNAVEDEAADQNLIQLVTLHGEDIAHGQFNVGFWEKVPNASAQIKRWLVTRETLDRVHRSKHLLPEDGFEHLFFPALELLETELQNTKI